MKALYLESDEEITSVIDRLKEIDDADVAIVVPKRAGLLQSIVNLKLLRYQAEQQQKRISVVTTDKTGRNLAAAVGLTVYQKLPEGKVAGRVPKPTESAVREPAAEIPIKFRRPPPAEPAAAGQPGSGAAAAAGSARSAKPDADDIGYKKGVEPEIITKTIAGSGSEAGAVKEPPHARGASSSVRSLPKKPRRSVRSALKLPKVKLPKIRAPKVKDVRERAAAAGKPKRRTGWKIAAAVALALLLAVGAAAAVVLPKATITVTPKTTPLNAQVPLTFSATAPAPDPTANVIPAKPIEVTKTVTRQVSSTGHGTGGGKASGDLTVTNSLPRNQSLVAQTRFQSPDGRIFRAQSGVVVPAGGQTTAHVVADEGGAAGNLPAGTKLSIPGLHGTTAVSGQADTALTGGTDSNATTVSAADADRAKSELAAQAAQEGIADAKSKLAVGYRLDPKIAATSVLDSAVNPPAGTAAPKFTVSGRVKVTYFTYQDQDFKNVLEPDLNAKVPAGAELVDPRTETFVVTQTSESQLSGTIKIDTFAATNVSKEKIKAAVRGQRPADAKAALESDGQITSVRIALFPFWVLSVPGALDKIEIRFESGTSGPATLPTPSVSPGASPGSSPGTGSASAGSAL